MKFEKFCLFRSFCCTESVPVISWKGVLWLNCFNINNVLISPSPMTTQKTCFPAKMFVLVVVWLFPVVCVLQEQDWVAVRHTARRASLITRRTMCCCRMSERSACAVGTRAQLSGRTCSHLAIIILCAASCTLPLTQASWRAAMTSVPASGTAGPPQTEQSLGCTQVSGLCAGKA